MNTHIIILFRNKRDETQIDTLGKQLFPSNKQAFIEAYNDATEYQYGYLLIDCDPTSLDVFKLKTNIFPQENTVCYLKQE